MSKSFKKNNKACPQCLKHSFCRRGFTLVETLVAISIFTVSLIGIMSVLASSIADTTYAKQKMTATYLAQEGIEYIRNMRDSDVLYLYDSEGVKNGWTSFIGVFTKPHSISGESCTSAGKCGFIKPSRVKPYSVVDCNSINSCKLFVSSTNGLYDSNDASGTDSGFTRTFWMNPINSDEVEIFSKVSWTTGSGPQSVTLSENLFNWIE